MVLVNFMKTKDNRRKLYFTIFVVLVCTALTAIPVAGLNTDYLKAFFGTDTIFGFADMISGGAMSKMSIGCFGISSYITASIVVQLASIIVPKVEEIRKDGERGKKRIENIQFILAMALTLAAGLAMASVFKSWGLWDDTMKGSVPIAVITWLVGTFVIVMLAQKVEDYGVGSGIGLILACNIVGRLPSSFVSYYQSYIQGAELSSSLPYIAGMAGGIFLFFLLCTYLQDGMLHTPIKQNRKAASALNTDASIPISVNVANVLPVVYASSLFSLPLIATKIFGTNFGETADEIAACFSSENWYAPEHPYYLIGLAGYIALIFAFSYFSSEMNFSAAEIADNMRKNGDVIPGVAPGQPTTAYLDHRRKAMAKLGFFMLLVIAIVPDLICTRAGISGFSFLGTSLLIVSGVVLDFARRIKAMALPNNKKLQMFS